VIVKYINLGNTTIKIPVIGQGTWKYGEDSAEEQNEIEALRFGIENGMTLIDTAEEYGRGGAERVVGAAIHDCRKDIFLTTKVSSKNCSYKGVLQAAEASLERLKTTYIDLYFQHWPSKEHDVAETMSAMAELVSLGLVKYIGVSNFSLPLLKESQAALGDKLIVCNQVGYHLNDRRIEIDILPYCQAQGITVMAYSPFGYAPQFFGQKGFPKVGTEERKALDKIGIKYGKTAYQVALNWILSHEGVVSIPKAKNFKHIIDNLSSLEFELNEEDYHSINRYFPKSSETL
jgi:diketogulonate reductase-like aldo/keto reductase